MLSSAALLLCRNRVLTFPLLQPCSFPAFLDFSSEEVDCLKLVVHI